MAEIITIPINSIIYDINIDMHSQGHWDDVNARQYDTNTRYIRATIWNNGIIYPITANKTITFSCTKPDGYGIDNIAGIDENGAIIYLITDQTTAKDGNFKAEYRIYSTEVVGETTISKRETTYDFKMHVAKSALNDATVISTNEFNVLTNTITILGDLITDATEAISSIGNIVETEAGRVVAEGTRVTNEDTRVTNEADRIAAELLRPDYIYLTQAQWDALPDEFQNDPDIIYEITDNDGILPNELQSLIDSTNAAKTAAESLLINRAGINDTTATLTEAYSGIKTQGLVNSVQSDISIIESELADMSYYLTPEMFGAVGDGVADDTDAIAQALASTLSKNIKAKGSYLISNTLSMPVGKQWQGGVLIPKCNIAMYVETDCMIADLILDYSDFGDTTSSIYGLYLRSNRKNMKLDDIEIKNFTSHTACNFAGIIAPLSTFDVNIKRPYIHDILVRSSGTVNDGFGNVDGILIQCNAYLQADGNVLLNSGVISDGKFENLNNIDASSNYVIDDAQSIYISGYPTDIMLPIGKSNYTIKNCNFVNPGKRAIKLQVSGVTIENVDIKFDTLNNTYSITNYGYNTTIKNVVSNALLGTFCEGLAKNSVFENITHNGGNYMFYFYSCKDSSFKNLKCNVTQSPFYILKTNATIYENNGNIKITDSDFGYGIALLLGTYNDVANTNERFFNFKNCVFRLADVGAYGSNYLQNINIAECTFINYKTVTATNLAFLLIKNGENEVRRCKFTTTTTIYPICISCIGATGIFKLSEISVSDGYTGAIISSYGDIASMFEILDCNFSNAVITTPINVVATSASTLIKKYKMKNIVLADNTYIQIGEPNTTNLLEVILENIKHKSVSTVPITANVISVDLRVNALILSKIFGKINNISLVVTKVCQGIDGVVYDGTTAYTYSFAGGTFARTAF